MNYEPHLNVVLWATCTIHQVSFVGARAQVCSQVCRTVPNLVWMETSNKRKNWQNLLASPSLYNKFDRFWVYFEHLRLNFVQAMKFVCLVQPRELTTKLKSSWSVRARRSYKPRTAGVGGQGQLQMAGETFGTWEKTRQMCQESSESWLAFAGSIWIVWRWFRTTRSS